MTKKTHSGNLDILYMVMEQEPTLTNLLAHQLSLVQALQQTHQYGENSRLN